jgi:hypothetical protein
VGINQEKMGGLLLESLVLQTTVLLILQDEPASPLQKTEVLFKPNQTILLHNIPYSLSDLVKQIVRE